MQPENFSTFSNYVMAVSQTENQKLLDEIIGNFTRTPFKKNQFLVKEGGVCPFFLFYRKRNSSACDFC